MTTGAHDINHKGFTVIEVLVSSVLVIFLLITVVLFIRQGREIEATDTERRTARELLKSVLEKNYDNSDFTHAITQTISHPPPYEKYTTRVIVTDVNSIPGIGPIDARKIDATVTWTTPNSTTETINLTKWIAELH